MKFILYALIIFSFVSLQAQEQFIQPNSDKLKYQGRNRITPDSTEMYWSGASVKLNFEGKSLKATLKDERADNFLYVIIDGKATKLKLEAGKKEYTLASDLKKGAHTAELYKITEYDRGKVTFYGFDTGKRSRPLEAPAQATRRIEVYGNSITCGYAVEDTVGDSPASPYENNYLSYAAITARHYRADYSFIAKSGIGITISWFPYVMPDVYDRLNPADSASHWDFNSFTPDVVVINLFQNDSWLVKMATHEQFKRTFGTTPPSSEFIINAYKNFLTRIRSHYPTTPIICVLGNMDATREGSPWPGYISEAAHQMNDQKIFTHFFPYKNTPGHPKKKEQQAMADSLIRFIDEHIQW